MLYTIDQVIPRNTAIASPVRITLPVTTGVLARGIIRWRWGSADLCGCRVLYHETAVWPLSRNSWIPSFDLALEYDEFFLLESDPYELIVEAYNLDTNWDHALFVGAVVEGGPDWRVTLLQIAEDVESIAYE